MRNILLTVSYDGTDFCGWQRQDKSDGGRPVRTVQGEIEKALEKIHKEHVNLTGSGRTDSGVHAFAQAANFYSPIDSIPVEKYIPAINAFLPDDIRIVGSSEVAQDFSSRFSATSRTYRYFIHTGNPFASEMRFVWPIHHKPDITVLNKMASYLRGEIDCATFAAAGDASLSTFRYIENARFFVDDKNPEVIVFEICANAFLWKMVRSLTGSLIFFEKSGRSPEYFKEVLDSHDRKRAGPTAPPSGLFLYQVSFDGVRRHA
ncbi:tRNA pseudouridine(38-40) synthase TruA [Treponema sp.]|uniref:tRNA pseudouridine(38-40) synthase TruA n=2 Tax=Treponema TaxID=157 RepID=UPI0025E75AF1|nr:tRNA pseudouridine(38-40) synthase TruA [Treponema sp.]MBR4321113.1 tRNA pseudouridine(38-40) synthase TruA [Treponema sp.]